MCTNSFFIRRLLELFSTVAMSTVSMRIVVMRYRPWRRERVLTGQERLENTSTKTNHQQNAIPFSQVRTSLLSLSLSLHEGNTNRRRRCMKRTSQSSATPTQTLVSVRTPRVHASTTTRRNALVTYILAAIVLGIHIELRCLITKYGLFFLALLLVCVCICDAES